MSLRNSITHFQHQTGITLVDDWGKITDDVALARHILERLNAHFHQTYDGNGVSTLNGDEYQYLPDFHKYWESHHPEIINAKIDRGRRDLPHALYTTRGLDTARIFLMSR
jgi:hypothetical protein